MYKSSQKVKAAAQRSLEQREREDSAPRLTDAVPNLTTLIIDITEISGTGTTKHRKHVVVGTAPALFEIRCGDARCEHGGHDITWELMRSLRSREFRNVGEHTCGGQTGSADCARRIQYEFCARYSVFER